MSGSGRTARPSARAACAAGPSVVHRCAVDGAEDLRAGGRGVEVRTDAGPAAEELRTVCGVARGDVRAVGPALQADALTLDGANVVMDAHGAASSARHYRICSPVIGFAGAHMIRDYYRAASVVCTDVRSRAGRKVRRGRLRR